MNLSHMRGSFSVVWILIIFLLYSSSAWAQDMEKTVIGDGDKTVVADDISTGKDVTAKDITRWSILGGTGPLVFLFGLKTWDWGNRHSAYSKKEGWFGEDTSFGGSDKAGHFMAHYMVQRGLYSIFDWTENGENQKWAYSIGTTMLVGLLIEVGDSYTAA